MLGALVFRKFSHFNIFVNQKKIIYLFCGWPAEVISFFLLKFFPVSNAKSRSALGRAVIGRMIDP